MCNCHSMFLLFIFLIIIQCNRGTSLDLFLKGVLLDTTTIFGVVGCGCSSAAEPVAEIIHQWNISIVRQNNIVNLA